jgi:hypothetical protein
MKHNAIRIHRLNPAEWRKDAAVILKHFRKEKRLTTAGKYSLAANKSHNLYIHSNETDELKWQTISKHFLLRYFEAAEKAYMKKRVKGTCPECGGGTQKSGKLCLCDL